MSGTSRITKGMIESKKIIISPTYNVTRLYHPLKININEQRPTITIRRINTKVNITINNYKE